jgi:hypothetical protein
MSVNDFDQELHDAIEELIDTGEIEAGTPAAGIAKRVVDQGYDSLTDAQKHVYDTYVVPALKRLAERTRINEIMNSARD